MSSATPRISVVMPVHNGQPFLDASIRSILAQSFSDFEFVILNDASTDGSDQVLRHWQGRDSRIRYYEVDEKQGLAGSSNFVVAKASAPLIARMDCDDISHPERLQRQWEVLQCEPDVVAIGTTCDGIDATGRVTRPRDRWRLIRKSPYIPFAHGSVMFRKDTFHAVGGYGNLSGAEDQDIFFRMRAHGRVVTLPDVLYRFRYHSSNSSRENGKIAIAAVRGRHSENGGDLAAFYMLGAMRLWAGEPPRVLNEMLSHKRFHWNVKSVMAVATASFGTLSPGALRLSLRTLIRARDFAAAMVVKDGRPYEWRFK